MSESGASFGGKSDRLKNVGGTPGGLVEFCLGAALAGVGIWMILNQVQVHTSGWRLWGMANGFGLSLLPILLGIGILFFNGKSLLGWLLTIVGFGIIIVGVLMQMDIYFARTSLFNTIVMFGLMAGGLGLIAKSLRPHQVVVVKE